MSIFNNIIDKTLEFEGGYIADPDDPGGATNYGISLRFLVSTGEIDEYDFDHDGDLTPIDIKNLTVKQARRLYFEYFWNSRYDELDEHVAFKLFDLSVNMGSRQAILLLQRVLSCKPFDGVYGDKTHRYLLHCPPGTYRALVASAARFYFDLADKRSSSRKYLYGWLRRCYAE